MRQSSRSRMNRIRGLRNSGFTLIEVIATVALLLILAVSTVGILSAVTEIGVRHGKARQARASVERLAKIFRSDVSEAEDVVIAESQWPLELRSPRAIVRYDWDAEKQTFRRSRQLASTKQDQVDRFLLPENCNPAVSISDRRVTLEINSPHLKSRWAIEARLLPEEAKPQ